MKLSTVATIGGTAGAALAGGAATATLIARRRARAGAPGKLLHARPEALSYATVAEGVTKATVWGDPERRAYAAFTRFAPGVVNAYHTHPSDLILVVLTGAYLYSTPEVELRVGAREYLFIPAGTPHASAGDPLGGCLFYEESYGRFSLDFVEPPAAARG